MLDMARKAVSKTQGISRETYDADENLRLADPDHRRSRTAGLGRWFIGALDNLNIVFLAPVPQRSLSGLGLECVPLVQAALRRKEFFEASAGTPVPKEVLDRRGSLGQFLRYETQREVAPEVQVILVWYRDVPV